jgi:hypothetical protein
MRPPLEVTMARKQQDNTPVPAAPTRVQGCQAREGPLVGGARPAGRTGVRNGLQARRGGGWFGGSRRN